MSNFVCAVILLSVALLFTGINSVIICNICDEMIELIDNGNAEKAKEIWYDRRDYLSFFIRDAEIDVVTAEAEAYSKEIAREDGEIEAAATSFRDAITELRHGELPSFLNVF